MLTSNVRSGVGCFVDQERAGLHAIDRVFSLAVPCESASRPLAEEVPLRALRQGAFCSFSEHREIIPFNERAPVAGIVNKLHDDRGKIMVHIHERGAFCARISGLSGMSKIDVDVYATEAQEFNLDGRGGVVGSLLAIESSENRLGILGFKRLDDARPIELGGNRRGGLVQKAKGQGLS